MTITNLILKFSLWEKILSCTGRHYTISCERTIFSSYLFLYMPSYVMEHFSLPPWVLIFLIHLTLFIFSHYRFIDQFVLIKRLSEALTFFLFSLQCVLSYFQWNQCASDENMIIFLTMFPGENSVDNIKIDYDLMIYL